MHTHTQTHTHRSVWAHVHKHCSHAQVSSRGHVCVYVKKQQISHKCTKMSKYTSMHLHTHTHTHTRTHTHTPSKPRPLVWRFCLYTPLFLNCSLMRWKYISATKFEKDALIEKAINLNIWKGISNGSLPFLFSEKLMRRMLYLLQGRLSFILPELTEIKSDSNLIKNECHCILHGAEKTRGGEKKMW